ncbi:MAG: tetraacyldisaccharide 4'-kinase [Acidobacteria bacterium]|nr:tetraacyldisaccharide 4'-kinase [Acidobacteriota bacterium]
MIRTLSAAYGAAAAWRRHWYAAHPARRRRLQRPVVSIGNLRVGGSGKTPVVAHLAALLIDEGERPAVLTRGYARRHAPAGVTIVSDGRRMLAGLDRAGDEPLLLARALPQVPVLVAADRYAAGRVAETEFGATVHLLDDGFQHLRLERTVDLLLAGADDLRDRPLPAGRLRESIAAAASADALLAPAADAAEVERLAGALGVATAFRLTRALGRPRPIAGGPAADVAAAGRRIFAAAGIARPERFFADLAAAGWDVAGTMRFRDHHRFTRGDAARMAAAAREAGAALVLTTEKDAVRLEPHAGAAAAALFAAVPLRVAIEPAAAFRRWLMERLR